MKYKMLEIFFTLSFIFMLLVMPLISHPLPLSILIMINTINLMVIMSMENMESFTSIILFLLFLGGILILFTYVSSLVPNKVYPKMNMYFVLFSLAMYLMAPMKLNMSYTPKMINMNMMNYSIISKINLVTVAMMIIILLMINMEMLTNKWMGSLRSTL